MKYVMGIDLGTSSTKALLTDLAGHEAGVGHGSYPIRIPQASWAEQDPECWMKAVKQAVAGALRDAGMKGEDVLGIGFSGQMHGVVALDKEKNLLGPAVIHLDQRAAEDLPDLREAAGNLMKEQLLNQPSAGMMISTLYWMKRHRPEIYDRIRYVLSPKDYIRFRLSGELGTDVTDAGATLAFSVRERRWCTELFTRLGLYSDIWMPVHESFEPAGSVTRQAAAETGLAEGTPVVYGAGDSMAALTGNGVVEKGTMACNIGTASQLAAVEDRPVFDRSMRIQTWCHTVPGHWVVQSGALNGGSTLSWLRDSVLRDTKPFSELDREAGEIPAGAEGLLFIPYLAGERTPYNDPYARGVFFGLGMHHEQGHLIRAVMEGVLYNLKECLKIYSEMHVSCQKLIASGGAARSVTWKQIQADMLDQPVYSTEVREEACQGAAVLAAVGNGVYRDIREACGAMVRMSDQVVEPIPGNVRLYDEKLQLFHDLYAQLRDMYRRI